MLLAAMKLRRCRRTLVAALRFSASSLLLGFFGFVLVLRSTTILPPATAISEVVVAEEPPPLPQPPPLQPETTATDGDGSTLDEEELVSARRIASDYRRHIDEVYQRIVFSNSSASSTTVGRQVGVWIPPLSKTTTTATSASLSPLELYFHAVANNRFDSSKVLTKHPFRVILNAESACAPASWARLEARAETTAAGMATMMDGYDVFLVVYVHSSADHFQRRDVIRRTWGNVAQYDGVDVRRVFVLGRPSSAASPNATRLQRRIVAESTEHGDIVQEDFVDSYANMTYKAVAGLHWVSQHCRRARFVLKTDDDVFVNMFTLVELLSDARLAGMRRVLLCNRWWAIAHSQVARDGKWGTPSSDWRYGDWPPFCQGLAFVMSADLAVELYAAAFRVPFLRMDDVFLTGFAPLQLDIVAPVALNSRYVRPERLRHGFNGPGWRRNLFCHCGGDFGADVQAIPEVWSYLVALRRGDVQPLPVELVDLLPTTERAITFHVVVVVVLVVFVVAGLALRCALTPQVRTRLSVLRIAATSDVGEACRKFLTTCRHYGRANQSPLGVY